MYGYFERSFSLMSQAFRMSVDANKLISIINRTVANRGLLCYNNAGRLSVSWSCASSSKLHSVRLGS